MAVCQVAFQFGHGWLAVEVLINVTNWPLVNVDQTLPPRMYHEKGLSDFSSHGPRQAAQESEWGGDACTCTWPRAETPSVASRCSVAVVVATTFSVASVAANSGIGRCVVSLASTSCSAVFVESAAATSDLECSAASVAATSIKG